MHCHTTRAPTLYTSTATADTCQLVVSPRVFAAEGQGHHWFLMYEPLQGRCDGRAPASFKLKEALPPGACAVLVKEDFLDIPLGSGSLLLDSLYVAVASPAGSSSSVLLLHVRSPLVPWTCMCMCTCSVRPRPRCGTPVNFRQVGELRSKSHPLRKNKLPPTAVDAHAVIGD